jgi:hypothetical protein
VPADKRRCSNDECGEDRQPLQARMNQEVAVLDAVARIPVGGDVGCHDDTGEVHPCALPSVSTARAVPITLTASEHHRLKKKRRTVTRPHTRPGRERRSCCPRAAQRPDSQADAPAYRYRAHLARAGSPLAVCLPSPTAANARKPYGSAAFRWSTSACPPDEGNRDELPKSARADRSIAVPDSSTTRNTATAGAAATGHLGAVQWPGAASWHSAPEAAR